MTTEPSTGYRLRLADDALNRALHVAGAVDLVGPKWCGKTTTAARASASQLFFQDPDHRDAYLQAAQAQPSLLLKGDKPLLLDEWQDAPRMWDAVRFAVDRDPAVGQFVLTGSAVPKDSEEVKHTGTGRFSRLRMRPMTLFESGESTGEVSLGALAEGSPVQGSAELGLEQVAHCIMRGGWPASVIRDDEYGPQRAIDYVESVAESDISRVDGVEKNPRRVRLLMRSLARNESTEAAMTTLQSDMAADEGRLSTNTIAVYLNALRRLYILDEQPPWARAVRSKVAMRSSPIRRYCDPSLPAALLRLSTGKLLTDFSTFGMLFESLAIRDLRVYAESQDATVSHYRDARGLECDAIVEWGDGRWGAIEVKLEDSRVEQAAATLSQIAAQVRSQHGGPPAFCAVVTATGLAYRRQDGIAVVPLPCLRP